MSLAVFAVITVQALQGTGETADELLASAEATEDVLLADMMHDAVRGDVLQALVSGGQGALYQGAVADLAEHDEFFREHPRRGRRRRPEPRGRRRGRAR